MYLLRAQDSDYSRLIDDSVPVLSQALHARIQVGLVFRALSDCTRARTPDESRAAASRLRTALLADQKAREALASARLLGSQPSILAALRTTGQNFDATVSSKLATLTGSPPATLDPASQRILGSSAFAYGTAVQQAADYVNSRAEVISDDYTAASHHDSIVVLGIAGWPLILAVAVIALTVAVVATMLLVFRQADAGDSP